MKPAVAENGASHGTSAYVRREMCLYPRLACVILRSFDKRSTQTLPRLQQVYRQLLEVTDAARLQDVNEAADLTVNVDDQQEARLRKSRDPGGSCGPSVGMKVIDEQLVGVVLNPLDRVRIPLRGEADAPCHAVSVGVAQRVSVADRLSRRARGSS